MLHLLISLASYTLFFLVKALAPTQPASWRLAEQNRSIRSTRD